MQNDKMQVTNRLAIGTKLALALVAAAFLLVAPPPPGAAAQPREGAVTELPVYLFREDPSSIEARCDREGTIAVFTRPSRTGDGGGLRGGTEPPTPRLYICRVPGELGEAEWVDATIILDGTITSADILDGTVTSTDILDGTVASADILNGGVASADILDETITSADILNGTIASADILDETIASADILNGTIASADILDGTVASADILDGTVASADLLNGDIAEVDLNVTNSPTEAYCLTSDSASGGFTWRPCDRFIRITSNVTTSSTSFVDITGLSFSVEASAYYFSCDLFYSTSVGTSGVHISVNGPATTALRYAVFMNIAEATIRGTSQTAYDTVTAPGTGNTTPLPVRVHGIAEFSASGTFALRFASESGGSVVATIFSGSSCRFVRL